jgi:hypothetical protein
MIWLYLFSGSLALYTVETADANQPFHITAVIAIALCLIPSTLEAFVVSGKAEYISHRILQKRATAKSED